ncbi:MAG TPA: GDP-mannose 4,6-dehydratase [Candidatus Baltobacteraceae bacterium]|jgi:GDP-4-dehydro-6-deoxy-D-mannose reductase|nr:GDP-mannose 4,6-dehydratase [Candidatus Baltobacteraceae bacterium]
MRALVTGAGGFVGPYLVSHLIANGYEVTAAGRAGEGGSVLPIDVMDPPSVVAAFDIAQPQAVFHLAAQSFVPESLRAPDETYAVNTTGTANVLCALRDQKQRTGSQARLVYVSSAEVYGLSRTDGAVDEERALVPVNPYGASKAAAETLVFGEVRSFGLDAVVARPFNHIGAGQHDRFVVPSLVAQLRAIAAGSEKILRVGNLETKRDFLDVRDVVAAYVMLAQRGAAGEAYNVCSGRPTSIREILGELIRIAHVAVEVREDPQLRRASDAPVSFGSNAKLRGTTGWEPKIPLRKALQDIYNTVEMSGA